MRASDFITEERAAALPSVLFVIVFVTLIVGLIMAATVMQRRFIQRDIDRIKARYLAEGAIFYFLGRDNLREVDSLEVRIPESGRATIDAHPFGGFYKVTSTAVIGGQQKKIRILAGARRTDIFDRAVVLGDTRSRLQLAGSTTIIGDVSTGPLRIKERQFKGEPFVGKHEGEVLTDSTLQLPAFDASLYNKSIERFTRKISHAAGFNKLEPGKYSISKIRSKEKTVFYSPGDITITFDEDVAGPVTIIAKGKLTLTGTVKFSDYSRFISGDKLEVTGGFEGRHGLFFGRNEIFIGKGTNCSGQFISRKHIVVSGEAYLRYPSVLYVKPTEDQGKRVGKIELSDASVVDGMAIIPPPEKVTSRERVIITIHESAKLRGAVYNTGQTELHGLVMGSVLTFQFGFYHSPTRYINWIKDGEIDRSERPSPFAVPLGFTTNRNYEILDWQEL